MARRALVEILGDATGFKRAVHQSVMASNTLQKDMKKLSVTAETTARTQVQASIKKTSRMRAEIVEYKKIAAAARHGSREQVIAANLAAKAEARLAHAIGSTTTAQNRFNRTSRRGRGGRGLGGGRELRGGIAASGLVGSAGSALAFGSLGFLGGFSIAAGIRATIAQASVLQEETEKTTVLFGQSQKQVAAWSKTLASSFGVSEEMALQSAGVFGNMFRSLHFGEEPASKMSERLVELAADMASFNNASPEDTLKALQSGLAGQVRPLRAYGVFLSIARIKQEAVSSGLVKNAAHLTTAQKVQAAYNIIMRDTKLQQGDVARNTESLSVAQSKLKANMAESQAVIGRALLPTMVHLANSFSRYLERTRRTGELQRNVNAAVRTARNVFRGLLAVVRPLARGLVLFSHALGGAKNTAKLFAAVFIGMKVLKWAAEFRTLAAAIRGVAAAEAFAGLGGAGAAGKLGRGRGIFGSKILPGGIAGAAAVGVGATFAQSGETSTNVGGVEVGPGGTVGYKDPLTGKFVLAHGYKGKVSPEEFVRRDIRRRHPELKRGAATGEDVGQRGAATRGQFPEPARGGGGGGRAGRLGFTGRMAKLQFALSQAELTGSSADDRKVLQQQASLLRARIATGKGSLEERQQLNEQLKGVNDQINSLDKEQADKQKQANDKKLSLKKKQADQEKEHMAKLRDKLKEDTSRMNEAIDTARGQFGELFQGPVLQPSEEANKRILGVRGGGQNVSTLTADLRAQTRDFQGWQKDLRRVGRRGGRKLRDELSALGPQAAEEVHALAGASPKQLHAFLSAYKARERSIRQAARDAAPKVFVSVTLDGKKIAEAVTVRQQKAARHTSGQRGGRHPGTVHGIH